MMYFQYTCYLQIWHTWIRVLAINATFHNIYILDFQLLVQSVYITTKVVSSNPDHIEVYSIQHCVKKFVSDLGQIGGFLRLFWFPPPIKHQLELVIRTWAIYTF
jgi:hypothetical protein